MTEQNKAIEEIEDGAVFAGLWGISTADYIGGVLAGNWVERRFGINPWVAGVATAGCVAAIEWPFIAHAESRYNTAPESGDVSTSTGRFTRSIKEVGSLAYISLNGATSAPKIDNSLGLGSSRKRRAAQVGFYGTCVSLWVAPVPGFEQASERAEDIFYKAIDTPQSLLLTAVGIYTAAEVTGRMRNRFSNWRHNRQQSQKAI